MLEPVGRCGPARRVAWRHGDHTAVTPLVMMRAPEMSPAASGRLLAAGAEASGTAPTVQITGGFGGATGIDRDTWAHITVDTAGTVQAHLAMLHQGEARPPAPEFATPGHAGPETRRPPDAAAARPIPMAMGAARVAHPTDPGPPGAAPETPAGTPFLFVDGDIAVAPGLAGHAGDARRFAAHLVAAREAAGPARLLMAPGVGLVHHAALLVYAGVDLLDTLAVERASAAGYYLTPEGAHEAATLTAPLCACAACRDAAPDAIGPQALLDHNMEAFMAEHKRVVGHMENGSLRELVEMRARAHPATAAVLRRLDRAWESFEARWPLAGGTRLLATAQESVTRPDVARFRARLREAYVPPAAADILLLLPCSAKKPYRRSRSHAAFRRVTLGLNSASRIHEVILTSPLGVVPRELEHTWPAAHYDVPVTGHWDREETHMIRHQLTALFAKARYTHTVSHLDPATHGLVADVLPPDAVHSGTPHPTDVAARDRLRGALMDVMRGTTAPSWRQRRLDDAHAVLAWQLGPEAAGVIRDAAADVSGRPPALRLYAERKNRGPLATFVPSRGLFALTLRAARLLYQAGCARTVQIDDFTPRGTVFAVGVRTADPRIRIDDEVVLVHAGEVQGVGRARMTGGEMEAFGRGAAVEVRHHA